VTLFSYVVARDYGFAPNPFGGFCTLATCKPEIRRLAMVGDWIVGTGSATRLRRGYLVYAMKVAEAMTFDAYWTDQRFQQKKPDLRASNKRAFGDNIYHRVNGGWLQSNSHHSFGDGLANDRNIRNDTQVDRVLVATVFAYWGGSGPVIPQALRNFQGYNICVVRGYKNRFPAGMEPAFVAWFSSLGVKGYRGRPIEWINSP